MTVTLSPRWEQAQGSFLYLLLNRGAGALARQLRSARHRALMRELAAAREAADLTQRDLAARLERAHSFVGKIESGERQLNVLEFCDYADALDVNPAELLKRILR